MHLSMVFQTSVKPILFAKVTEFRVLITQRISQLRPHLEPKLQQVAAANRRKALVQPGIESQEY